MQGTVIQGTDDQRAVGGDVAGSDGEHDVPRRGGGDHGLHGIVAADQPAAGAQVRRDQPAADAGNRIFAAG